ncbi:class I SAM-dependent RNA methyltransferase [Candidatus Gracilibacteria bacterium]|nr:MAG: class I SAM-dependent RNA methyltransferase [Candidatus Gracilibacteria bacterium]
MKFVLSTIAGVESIAKKEIERVGGKIEEVTDRLVIFSGDAKLMVSVNLWSRVGNKLYILLEEKEKVIDFDNFFETIKNISFKKYFKKNNPILVKASSTRSELFAERTMQSLGKKAIISSLVGAENKYFEDESEEKVEILLLLVDNKLRILLNTSGEALHKRGYRRESGEAPIKESLAAALVLLSNWKFKNDFFDPFCGSGTIVIEALMIAKNIAPGLKRKFAFEKLGLIQSEIIENERNIAKQKEFNGNYKIFASDIDEEILEIAKQNVKRAGLSGQIIFQKKDFRELLSSELNGTLVSNPPYGERLKTEDLEGLYKDIDKIFRKNKNLNGGIISSFLDFDKIVKKDFYKKRKLYNGGEMCYFWRKNTF